METLSLIINLIITPEFALFILMLFFLMVFHKKKLLTAISGFSILSLIYLLRNGAGAYIHHLTQPGEYHLLYNLILLLPGFGLVAYYFEESGFDERISRVIRSDKVLLWVVFCLSAVLDNIAAAMIGGVLLLARYGKDTPFIMVVSVIAASNLGGAGSFAGDTTTVMLFVSGVSIVTLAKGFVAAIAAQVVINLFASRHDSIPVKVDKDNLKPLNLRMFLPMIAVPGLALGNIMFDQPGIGLWVGLTLGVIAGRVRFHWEPIRQSLENTFFLTILVATAGLLPLVKIQPVLAKFSKTTVAIILGLLSPWFDNIPLTKIAIDIGGFDWGLLAYCVGFGGSAMWFGSSAGVAIALKFPQVYETKRWIKPFFIVMLAYLFGIIAYLGVFRLFK
ncbi:citrate transporter [Candidatus Magnetobacterium bavaricum]|uniref:Citrate transporter n=1 Tax=Candidatus Magnetobacterium bavaricum TaxID=29290 RepID=A0A0F3GI13_9BACT|nr:citrate transporter [Candidatus Magnetobacterium bavaricum]